MSPARDDIENVYKELARALPSIVEAAWNRVVSAEGDDLDRIAELHDRGWLYAYGVLIHRVRRHKLVERILNYARLQGFSVEPRYEYDSEEDEFAYTLVGRSRRMSEKELWRTLEMMCCVILKKAGQNSCIPLLRVNWENNTFDAQLVAWAKIDESLNELQ